MRRAILILLLPLLLLSLPAGLVVASSHNDRLIKDGERVKADITVSGGTFEIEAGGVLEGDLVLFGGSSTVDGQVIGDVSMFGGHVQLNGQIDGDVVQLGGNIDLGPSATVSGECVQLGGNVSEAEGTSLGCVRTPLEGIGQLGDFFAPPTPPPVRSGFLAGVSRFLGDLARAIGLSIALGIAALGVASVFPRELIRVSAAVRRKPAASGTVGVLTAIAVPSLLALLAAVSGVLVLACGLGLLGFPIVLVMALGLGAAAVLGWVTLGQLLGQRLAGWLRLDPTSLPVTATVGTVALTLFLGLLDALPFVIGVGLVQGLLLCVGLGAVALTKFGTRPYPLLAIGDPAKIAAAKATLPPGDEEA